MWIVCTVGTNQPALANSLAQPGGRQPVTKMLDHPSSSRGALFGLEARLARGIDRIAVVLGALELEQLPLARALVGNGVGPGLLQRVRVVDCHLIHQGIAISWAPGGYARGCASWGRASCPGPAAPPP